MSRQCKALRRVPNIITRRKSVKISGRPLEVVDPHLCSQALSSYHRTRRRRDFLQNHEVEMSGLPVDRTSVAGSEDIERHLNVGFSPCSKCVRWDRTGTIPETVRLQENPAGCCELCKTFWAFAVDKFKSFSTVTIFYYPSELHDHELQIWVEQQDPRYSASKFKIYARAGKLNISLFEINTTYW